MACEGDFASQNALSKQGSTIHRLRNAFCSSPENLCRNSTCL